jgi:hypothetical protein
MTTGIGGVRTGTWGLVKELEEVGLLTMDEFEEERALIGSLKGAGK